ncbi:MAG: response regulator transcription factor [Bacteroidia bacterium]|jgi:DNA-binding NarL/FixJ family response regulator|nr:response regulator transcription factor [Bacteroidia bacterium]
MNEKPLLRLAIADDQAIFRNGLKASLRPYTDIQIVCEAENGLQLIETIQVSKPDIVLCDMKMPDMDGIGVCQWIRNNMPTVKVIGLSVYDHYHYISSFFEAGGSGYVLKETDIEEIVNAIQITYQQGSYIGEATSLQLVKRLIEMKHPSIFFSVNQVIPFKPQELEIIRLIAQELTTNQIAQKLNLSAKTIENYRGIILSKIGAKNTAGLLTYAISKGIIVVPT